MTRFAKCSAGLLLLVASLHTQAQQIASVDLTNLPQDSHKSNAELPKGCESLLGGIVADGAVISKSDPPSIIVQIIRVSDENPIVGQDIVAEVRLQNSSNAPIQIPWSTDPNSMENGQDPTNIEWETASFDVVLNGNLLKTLTYPLYGSKVSPGSLITIHPGQWITATIKFNLENGFHASPAVKTGDGQLSVEWKQAREGQQITGCKAAHENYEYIYKQKNPSSVLRVRSNVTRAKEQDRQ